MNQFVHVEYNDLGRPAKIIAPRPSDLHTHPRWETDGMIDAVAPEIMRHNLYALAMPNQGPGDGNIIRTITDAHRVYHRIMDLRAKHRISTFRHPLMTLYLTSDITPKIVEEIGRSSIVRAIKSYPVHSKKQEGTTNSGLGIPFDECSEIIRAMEDNGVPLLIHAEDINDENGRELPHALREAHCIEKRLWRFREKHPLLRLCLEHGSTVQAVTFVQADTSGNTVMTATPHHMLFIEPNLHLFSWRNHLRCMPYVKTAMDREAVRRFATSGDPRCIAGSDTAPHPASKKQGRFEDAACGCWLPHAIALYALAFIHEGVMDDRFAQFMSFNGPDWWRLARPDPDDTITIRTEHKSDIPAPTPLPALNDVIIPLGWTTEGDRYNVGFVAE